jgi:thiamine pyrophosphate-dependent acetolactate synthase large subunit-like protein
MPGLAGERFAMAEMGWGSDAVAAMVRKLGYTHAALVPGSSFRGLHDSFVNYLDDVDPKMLVCLHEEHCVAIAHGWAKVTGQPMLAVVHSNVGLMHATMAFYDAWCDRAPIMVIGATGPVDANKRRPWIDWIHSSRDQASMIRPYVKWDDQPGSVEAAMESLLRAHQAATTAPCGPTYVVLDVEMQEAKLPAPLALPDVNRFVAPIEPVPARADVERAVRILKNAKNPVILMGRCSRDVGEWNERIALAEALNAKVISDLKVAAQFPTDHPLHVGRPSGRPTAAATEVIRNADVILCLEAVDLAGVVKQVFGDQGTTATIISASLDRYVHNGWSMDHQGLPAVDIDFAVGQNHLVRAMLEVLGNPQPSIRAGERGSANQAPKPEMPASPNDAVGIKAFSSVIEESLDGMNRCYIRVPLGSNGGALFEFRHPLDYLGGDGGGGVGAGPGLSVGAALALKGTDRLPVAILGDGDTLMGLTAFWTAVANKIPLLVIICNNRCYYNDIVHQERMAVVRDRPVERKWIGQTIDEPAPDFALLARGQGAIGIGPVRGVAALREAIAEGVASVKAGNVVVIDAIVAPEYDNPAGVIGAHAAPPRA